MITGLSYIGKKLSGIGTKTYKTINPKLNVHNPQVFIEATKSEIDEAVKLASEAFKVYQSISGKEKAKFLNAIADEILSLDGNLIQMYCNESGLSENRAHIERTRTIFQLRSFADLVEEGSWVAASIDIGNLDRYPKPKPDLRKMNIPLGPIAVFGASNFPLAYSTAGGDTASALAAGCPVVVKSHPMHAGTGELVASAIIKAAKKTNMPDGVFSNINSSGVEVGKQLVLHPNIKAVGFTGSLKGGRALFDFAANRPEPIPVFAEMGSVNPVVLFPEAIRKAPRKWAKIYADSITLDSGQFCTNPGLMFGIKDAALSEFITCLAEEIVKIEPSCMLHPNIIGAFEEKKNKAINQDRLKVVTDYKGDVEDNYARQVITTVEGSTFLENTTLHQEVFGPFSLIVQCESFDQLELIINKMQGQLTGTIIAEKDEAKRYQNIIEALKNRVGRLIFNGVPTGVEVCPSMMHGGPYPATTDSRFTAVGVNSIKRWVRPVSYQNWSDDLLPEALKNDNPLNIFRKIKGLFTKSKI